MHIDKMREVRDQTKVAFDNMARELDGMDKAIEEHRVANLKPVEVTEQPAVDGPVTGGGDGHTSVVGKITNAITALGRIADERHEKVKGALKSQRTSIDTLEKETEEGINKIITHLNEMNKEESKCVNGINDRLKTLEDNEKCNDDIFDTLKGIVTSQGKMIDSNNRILSEQAVDIERLDSIGIKKSGRIEAIEGRLYDLEASGAVGGAVNEELEDSIDGINKRLHYLEASDSYGGADDGVRGQVGNDDDQFEIIVDYPIQSVTLEDGKNFTIDPGGVKVKND